VSELRPEMPELPERMRRLPVDRGYPVPWFVAWLDGDGEQPCEPGHGRPDFRVIRPGGVAEAWTRKRCWICGGTLGSYRAFTLGSMCAVNRTSAEPPSHRECADFAARACPFLTRPHAKRREVDPEIERAPMPGIPLMRNPGVALVWVTRHPRVRRVENGVLFNVGPPTEVRWYCEGRPATRAECVESIESGLDPLRELAANQRRGPEVLERLLAGAMRLLPEEVPA
jgi:hypothetical protein